MSSTSIEYKLKLKDNLTSVLNKAETASHSLQSAFSGILAPLNKIITILNSINNKIKSPLKTANDQTKILYDRFGNPLKLGGNVTEKLTQIKTKSQETSNQFDKLANKAEKTGLKIQNGLFGKLQNFGMSFQGIRSIGTIIQGMASPILEEGMARETAATNFGTLLGNEQQGKQYAEKLRGTNAATLYGTNTINQNAQSMLAYGLDKDTTLDVLTAIGDIAMGDANKMSSLATAFSQMSSLGKLQSQDWKQMVGAGFNPFNQMQKDLGKTAEELDAMMSKGQISADMVKNAFINATKEGGQFAGALKNVMDNTLQGKIASLQSMLDDLKGKIFDLITPIMSKLLPVVQKLLPMVDKFLPILDVIMAILSPIIDWISQNIEELFTLATAIGAVAAAIYVCTTPITGIVVAIGALIYALVNVIKYWDEWGKYIILICPPLALVMNLIQSVKKHWDSIVDGFTNGGILEGIIRIGLTIADAILSPVENLLELLAKIPGVGKLAEFIGGGVTNLRDKINNLLPKPEYNGADETASPTDNTMQNLLANVNGSNITGDNALNQAVKTTNEATASGGTRNTQITINLDKMVENINFEGSLQDNKENLTTQLQELLLRVLYSAQMSI